MGDEVTRPPEHDDFLPRRAETLRESFQEKIRRKSPRAADAGPEVRVLSVSHGPHGEIDRLHPHLRPGTARLKVTLDIFDAAEVPPEAVSRLRELFPGLDRHRCGSEAGAGSPSPADGPRFGDEAPPGGAAAGLGHLLLHLALELVSSMEEAPDRRALIGAHHTPTSRFDLFLENADPRVGAAALRSAAHVVAGTLLQGHPPAGSTRIGETARYFLGRPRSVLSPGDVLVHLQGDPVQLEAALRYLAGVGFLVEERFRFDFAGTLRYRYRLAPDFPPFSDNLLA